MIKKSRSEHSSFVPGQILALLSLAMLIAAGVLYMQAEGADGGQHLTRAEWRLTETPAYAAPPATLDRAMMEAGAPGPAAPDQAAPTSTSARWQTTALPLAMARTTAAPHAGANRVTWFRVPVPPPPAAASSSSTSTSTSSPSASSVSFSPLALYGARLKTDASIAIYADGRLIHRAQEAGQLWSSLFTPLWVTLERRPGDPPVREIVLRIEHTPDYLVAVSSLWLGPAEQLRRRYQMRLWLQRGLPAMLNAAFLAVGIFALFVWFKRRHESGYLLFFLLATTSFIAHLHYYVDLPIANDWLGWVTLNSLFWLLAVVHFFLRQLHGRPLRWLTRCLLAVSAAVGVATLPLAWALPNTPGVLAAIYGLLLVLGLTAGLVGAVSAWRRSREGRLVASCLGVCVLLGVPDWMLHNNVAGPENWFTGAYTNAVTFIAFGALMYLRYVHAIREVELVNASLAQRLRVREAELELSHRRLREVELRQTISDERQRLMQDMHDGLGSSLISAIRSVERHDISDGAVTQVLRGCLDDLKLAIDSMEPVEADLLLLLATLRFRLEPRLEGAGVALRWRVTEVPPLDWLDPTRALHILRIVQESIANILHHTRASDIEIATAAAPDHVTITVSDNGGGFDVAATLLAARGHGLLNQQRRARALNGAVMWDSGPHGTRFTLRLPLRLPQQQP